MVGSLENLKCQLILAGNTELEVQNFSIGRFENDYAIVRNHFNENDLENNFYSNATIIINANNVHFHGTIRLKGWSTGLRKAEVHYPKCNNTWLVAGDGSKNYNLQQGMS